MSPGAWIVWPDAPRPGRPGAADDGRVPDAADRRPPGDGRGCSRRRRRSPGRPGPLRPERRPHPRPAADDADRRPHTATALLSWAIVALARHPDAQERARAEVAAVLGDTPPTAESAGRLPYVEQVIKETLRLYPPIHVGNAARPVIWRSRGIASRRARGCCSRSS
ncbi:MAG: cytochrome P450 [Anaerolineae bacterium]